MYQSLLKFEWAFYSKKISFYFVLLFFTLLGILFSTSARFPFPETAKNSPYVITYIMGLISMLGLFTASIIGAQSIFRESDSNFETILYATPIKKTPYLLSKFLSAFSISFLAILLFTIGLMFGHQFLRSRNDIYIPINIWHYVSPFLTLIIPNTIFCIAIICSIGSISKNKLALYISGLFIYFLYWGISMFSNSPIMANSSPVTDASMNWMAKLDPFGIAAFFEQTKYWTAIERNTKVLELKANFLVNRIIYFTIAMGFLTFAYAHFNFIIGKNKKVKKTSENSISTNQSHFEIKIPKLNYTLAHHLKSIWSFIKIDLHFVVLRLPFLIIVLGWLFFLCLELYGDISGTSRMPQRFATSALIVNDILKTFPLIGIIIILFYSSELFWRNQQFKFDALENSTPVSPSVLLISKWITISIIPIMLLSASIVSGCIIQFAYNNATIDWKLYVSLFYLIGLPLIFCAILAICIQALFKNKYIGLSITAFLMFITNTSLGNLIGIKHPMLKFANAFQGVYSNFNGFGQYINAFHIKMLYWLCITIVIALITNRIWSKIKLEKKIKLISIFSLSIVLSATGAFYFGSIIYSKTKLPKANELIDWQYAYEKKYNQFKQRANVTITKVITNIDLHPELNSYDVNGIYILKNKSRQNIDSILIYADPNLNQKIITIGNAKLQTEDTEFGHYWFQCIQPLKPGDSISMQFSFHYECSAFNRHDALNSIIENGSFMRISNYFPRIGYNADNEIEDELERKNRNLATSTPLIPLENKSDTNYDYNYIQLDATISTSINQTVIGVGELVNQSIKNNRQYFHYKTTAPIPFRFAISSAQYAVTEYKHKNILISAYYHPNHSENIQHIINIAKQTLDYCEQNFSPYPHKTLRIAEISSFTRGFAATAYPNCFFINETFGFQNKVEKNHEKDILNELVSHEISHFWWGNAKLNPQYKAGSKTLTETLAMYTELMIFKNTYGLENSYNRIRLHRDIYLNSRALQNEEPLYLSNPNKPFLCYDKGMVIMNQLYQVIGEKKMNTALQQLLTKHQYPNMPPVSIDLLHEIYEVTDSIHHEKINEWFKKVITYDFDVKKIFTKKTGQLNQLNLEIQAFKYEENNKGLKKSLPLNGELEIEITMKDQSKKIVVCEIIENKIITNIPLLNSPIEILIDPKVKYININENEIHNTPLK
jgi:ABC-2 type transport system permease protein